MDDGLALLVGSFGKEEQYDARNTQKQLKCLTLHAPRSFSVPDVWMGCKKCLSLAIQSVEYFCCLRNAQYD